MKEQRKLVAIMFTDIVGYTALMSNNEQNALRILRKKREVLKPLIRLFNGEWLKEMGDGTLSSFSSAVDAVNCAHAIQLSLKRQPHFKIRIGIHVGDIVYSSGDIFGDGVNVASRIEPLAEPGGICISEQVYDAIQSQPNITANLVGEKNLKNVLRPIKVYELLINDIRSMDTFEDDESDKSVKKKRRLKSITLFAAVLLLFLVSILFPVKQYVADILGLNESPSLLAVIPFRNVANDPAVQTFSDGLFETISSKLTQLDQFRTKIWVIPAGDIIGQNITTPAEANAAFGAKLVVTGSVQYIPLSGYQLTLNLIEIEDSSENIPPKQLSSALLSYANANIYEMQDEVVIELAKMLGIEVTPQNAGMFITDGTSNAEAYELYLKARGMLLDYRNLDKINASIGLFNEAIALDSLYSSAYAGIGEAFWRKYEVTRDIIWVDQSLEYCERSLALNDQQTAVYITMGSIYSEKGDYEKAITFLRYVSEIEPINAAATRGLAVVYEAQGRYFEAEMTFLDAIDLKQDYWAGYNDLGVFYYLQDRLDDAVAQFTKVVELSPKNIQGFTNLGGLYFYLERWSDAEKLFNQSLNITPNYVAYSNLGTLHFYDQEFVQSAQMYEKALELEESDYRIWGNLASAYYWSEVERDRSTGIYKEAIEKVKIQLTLDPNDNELLSDLAMYQVMIKDTESARSNLRLIEHSLVNNAIVMFIIGDIYEQLGERDESIKWIGKALEAGISLTELQRAPGLKGLIEDNRFLTLAREILNKS